MPKNNELAVYAEMSDADQMELFRGWFASDSSESRTVELFDAIPKYIFDKAEKTTDKIELVTRSFRFRDQEYSVEISPAMIRRGEKTLGIYPGEREEIVVRTLLQMTVQQRAKLRIQVDSGVTITAFFTLSQIRKQLQAVGHDYKFAEIDEALEVAQGAVMRLTGDRGGKNGVIRSALFQSYGAINTAGDKSGDEAHRYVVFNPLVTSSILEGSTRLINFERVMSLKSPLARWLYDRLSHMFRQAEKCGFMSGPRYSLGLDTILRESGFTREAQQRNNVTKIRAALKELQKQKILNAMKPYDEEVRLGDTPAGGGRRPIADVIWTLYPSAGVVDEIIRGNQEAKAVLRRSDGGGNQLRSLI